MPLMGLKGQMEKMGVEGVMELKEQTEEEEQCILIGYLTLISLVHRNRGKRGQGEVGGKHCPLKY